MAGKIIEPPEIDLDIVHMMEGLNNPTSARKLDIEAALAGEIIEPLMFTWRVGISIHSWDKRGSIIPPTVIDWVA